MNTFQTVEQLNQVFVGKQLENLPKSIKIGDVEFMERDSLVPESLSELNSGKKIIAIYSPKARPKDDRLALVWGLKSGLIVAPLLAKTIGTYRGGNEGSIMKEAEAREEEPTIGSHIEVILSGFNDNKPIRGKVDTGATVNSLHAENIKIRKDPLDFDSQLVDFEYDGKKFTVGLVQQQSVQSADGGVSYRPVVKFNVKFEQETIEDVLFNLNDRGDMEDKLLIGMNLLSDIGYKIDPKKESEEVDDEAMITEEEWKWIEQQIDDDTYLKEALAAPNEDDIHMLYEFLIKQDYSFADLLKYVKINTIYTIDNLES